MCLEVVNNFANADPPVSNAFFQQYFLSIMQDIFYVLTDTDHKSGFKLQSMLLARMFQLVETGGITVPLFDPASVPDPNISNSQFLKEYTANLLKNAFPHVQLYVPPLLVARSGLTDVVFATVAKSRRSSSAWENSTTTSTASSSPCATSSSS